ncbi:hypothetical protein E1293_18600 [Actinomadura darangshiensis]|uniref:Uncharacterized protein n=1 Tax=Actinomadura darangshiensis TaxID=705336 RepID=A0A4V2YVG7_9ACTN|nr:hypothetical protein [Actinomadura darangshiensis]TDD81477.1 hypothetical protein E1293_18600 [Actinomadura darangshiensis]
MTDPITSEYDDDPVDPDAEGGESTDPPDLGNTDSPDLTVWQERPSFDEKPQDIGQDGGGDEPPDATPSSGDFSINLESVATNVENMLSTSRELVTKYEALRTNVLANQSTIFGQQSTEEDEGFFDFSTGEYWNWDDGSEPDDPSIWQKPAMEFAAQMNPMQRKVLQQVGGVLELVGEYIALANHSGQVYAEADRNSQFPPPPSNTVTG